MLSGSRHELDRLFEADESSARRDRRVGRRDGLVLVRRSNHRVKRILAVLIDVCRVRLKSLDRKGDGFVRGRKYGGCGFSVDDDFHVIHVIFSVVAVIIRYGAMINGIARECRSAQRHRQEDHVFHLDP